MNWNDYVTYKDGKLYWKIQSSNRIKIGEEVGSSQSCGYKETRINNKRMLAHRIIWELHYGSISDGLQIDHINGIRNDNRIENLRLATPSQQGLNAKLRSDNSSGIKGVYKMSKNMYQVALAKKKYYMNDFFESCCMRKSWEGKNVYNRQY